MTPLELRFSNPLGVPIWVSVLGATVQELSAPHACGDHPCACGAFTAVVTHAFWSTPGSGVGVATAGDSR